MSKSVKKTNRKVTKAKADKMTEMLLRGKTLSSVAKKFGVSVYAVKYNTDSSFKRAEIVRKSA